MKNFEVVLFKDNGTWIAQLIQYDIAEQGRTIRSAMESLMLVVLAHLRQGDLSGLPQPPHEMVEKFNSAQPMDSPDGYLCRMHCSQPSV